MRYIKILMIIYGTIIGYLVYALEYEAIIIVLVSVFILDRYVKNESFRDKVNVWI